MGDEHPVDRPWEAEQAAARAARAAQPAVRARTAFGVVAVLVLLGGCFYAVNRSGATETPAEAYERQAAVGWEDCRHAEQARRAAGDPTYDGVAPVSEPAWPDWRTAQIKVYDTGVWDYRAVLSGVPFSCLYDARHSGPARVGWGT